MIWIDRVPQVQQIKLDVQQRLELESWISVEIEDALSARAPQEQLWREMLRLYEGVPKNPVRNTPIENAPNIEVTLGAIACDALYAQMLDLIYAASPPVTVRATPNSFWVPHAKAMQGFVDWAVRNDFGSREEIEEAIIDDVKLGTAFYYIPFVESIKKTKSQVITSRGPKIIAMPPEDVLLPGGARANLQLSRWLALRFYYGEHELNPRAEQLDWDLDGVQMTGAVGWVRTRREMLGRTTSQMRVTPIYETFDVYCYYDIDGDGQYEDLLVHWDRTSRKAMKVGFNPYDKRPVERAMYQRRGHLAYGIGVMEMLRPYQEEATELHNARTANVVLANARLWKAKTGQVPTNMSLWPNKIIELDDPDSLKPEAMADVYPSIAQAEAMTISLAERRVGVNEMNLTRPSQVMGSRTPGITMMSMLQQINRRFTPAFDGMKLATAGAIVQAMDRYAEQIKAGDQQIEGMIREVTGVEDGNLIIDLLKTPMYTRHVNVELTASTAQSNREADRQNAIMLVNVLAGYYDRALQLISIASNPQTPPPVAKAAKLIAEKAGEIIERTIRTFDSIRDPRTFVIDVEGELDGLEIETGPLAGLARMMMTMGQEEGAQQQQQALPRGGGEPTVRRPQALARGMA